MEQLYKKVTPVSDDLVEQEMAFTVVVAVAGVVHELGLPIQISMGRDKKSIDVVHPESLTQEQLLKKKEEFRTALNRRGLDVMLVRRIMRLFFATTVEEP